MPERQDQIPTAKVQRGDVVIRAYSRGELRAARTVTLTAPNLFGTVQVTDLAPMGSLAKEKDLIVEYDDSERQSALEEARLSRAVGGRADQEGQGGPGDHAEPGRGDAAEDAVQRAPRRTRSAAQSDHRGDRRQEERAHAGAAEARAAAARNRHRGPPGAGRFAAGGAAGAAQPQPDRRAARIAAHRLVQDAGADHRPGGHQAESRRQFQFRTADAGHSRGRHAAAGHAGGGHSGPFRGGSLGQGRRTGSRQSEGRPGGARCSSTRFRTSVSAARSRR